MEAIVGNADGVFRCPANSVKRFPEPQSFDSQCLHDLKIGGLEGYVAVPTWLVAGTPLWVALEGIQCPSDGNPRTEDECHTLSPL